MYNNLQLSNGIIHEIENRYRERVVGAQQRYDCMAIEIFFAGGSRIMMNHVEIQQMEYMAQNRQYYYSSSQAYQQMQYQVQVMNNQWPCEVTPGPLPKPKCKCCGGEHSTILDKMGWCSVRRDKFWARARKVYWHRFIKNKKQKI